MSEQAILASLRQSLREKFPEAHRHALPVEQEPPAKDAASEVRLTFPTGTLNEVVTDRPCGGLSQWISRLLEEDRDLPLALVDSRDGFDPSSYGDEKCRRVFWVRCSEVGQALQVTDLLLRDGNLPFVLLDLHLAAERELRRIPRTTWYRYKTEARQSGVSLVVMAPSPIVPCAHQRIVVDGTFTLSHLEECTPVFRTRSDDEGQQLARSM